MEERAHVLALSRDLQQASGNVRQSSLPRSARSSNTEVVVCTKSRMESPRAHSTSSTPAAEQEAVCEL